MRVVLEFTCYVHSYVCLDAKGIVSNIQQSTFPLGIVLYVIYQNIAITIK